MSKKTKLTENLTDFTFFSSGRKNTKTKKTAFMNDNTNCIFNAANDKMLTNELKTNQINQKSVIASNFNDKNNDPLILPFSNQLNDPLADLSFEMENFSFEPKNESM